ncbi:cystathionine gamma-synthase [Marivirga atlantica]|jgi:cystathionine beta-lyase|uniref:Cystathionine gamma-synthase n=1 Tax=Marivirga atlantica TaxID=1548457 RepID=A0A937DKK4_9BACT|nr:cystathionine gamma-synthase [Marivirga atlantica]MBL0766326.1 cystathionine gamma-synthase [Marivirga atlantica]
MSDNKNYRFGTKAIHAGVTPDPATGAIMTPIYQTTTYAQSAPGEHKGYEYSRSQNPTRTALEESMAALENGKYGFCYGSGLGAIDAVIKMLNPGDEVISTSDLYGGSYRIFTKIFEKYGIKFKFIDMSEVENIEACITKNTKLIWVETPTNPMMTIIDIEGAAKIAKAHHITLCVDNTFSTPYLQNPLDLGADIVMHSVTKYIAGHSDVVMGALVTNSEEIAEQLGFIQKASGAIPGPQDCFLVLRGVKTLHLRMQRHCENGASVANFLQSCDAVDKVLWPGFKNHKNHDIASRQMHGFGGMISFSLKEDTKEAAIKVLKKFKLFTLAESLGGVESLCGHPASMTHASIPKAEREKVGLSDSLIRLSVGVEDIEDLIVDLKQALS